MINQFRYTYWQTTYQPLYEIQNKIIIGWIEAWTTFETTCVTQQVGLCWSLENNPFHSLVTVSRCLVTRMCTLNVHGFWSRLFMATSLFSQTMEDAWIYSFGACDFIFWKLNAQPVPWKLSHKLCILVRLARCELHTKNVVRQVLAVGSWLLSATL